MDAPWVSSFEDEVQLPRARYNALHNKCDFQHQDQTTREKKTSLAIFSCLCTVLFVHLCRTLFAVVTQKPHRFSREEDFSITLFKMLIPQESSLLIKCSVEFIQ